MRLKKGRVNIGKTPCTVIQFNYKLPKDKKFSQNRMHFIQILDRSGSMSPYIGELIENVKKTINVMKENDLLTVIWFSGPGQYKVLLKGASPAEHGLKNQLDKLKSTIGTTCFSEAIYEAKAVIDDLLDLCGNFVITLFTDGEPVVPWSVEEEENRAKSIISGFSGRILSFNTIGYGGYYNVNFLKELAGLSKFGRHAHSTKIDEYLPIFNQNLKSVENMSTDELHIQCPGKDILCLTNRNSRLDKENLKINLSSRSVNKFYIISQSEEEFLFKIDDEEFNSSNIKSKLTEKDIENLLYGLSYEQYYRGCTDSALDILTGNLKDKYHIQTVMSAFTAKERQKCTDNLLKAALNKKINIQPRLWGEPRRLEGEISEEELLENRPCVMEVLEVFERNDDKFIPLPSESYKRIGRKVIDNYNAFKADESKMPIADFKDLVFTKEKLNISIRYEIQGHVKINPRQAKAAGFKTSVFDAKIYREQTIIKDGDINIEKFQALVSADTLKYLGKIAVKDLFTVSDEQAYSCTGYTLINMNISKLPVLNRAYISRGDSLDYVLDSCYEQRAAECKQKVLKYFLEKNHQTCKAEGQFYTKEQSQLLKSFGLCDGIYQGIDVKPVSETTDQYEYRFFEFALKGYSTLPKVESVIEKMAAGKKLNGPETIMANAIKYIKQKGLEKNAREINKLLEAQKAIIRKNTRNMAVIKLAKTLTGGWWQALKLNSKDNYLYEREDKTLVVKVVKKIVNV